MKTIFSTADVHPRQRFDYWLSVAREHIVEHAGLGIEGQGSAGDARLGIAGGAAHQGAQAVDPVCIQHRRRGIATKLLEEAIRFCHEHGYLKVKLDTFVEREAALRLFEKLGFRHSGTKWVGEKELSYFYLDLYHGEPRKEK